MKTSYNHSVYLEKSKCKGCTNCLKHCPNEAIRIRDGHAVIDASRCIDCGECIRICPYHAKKAVCDKLSCMDGYKWKIALPAPSLYGQFDNLDDIDIVLQGLLNYGFDDVYEVAKAAELVSGYTRKYLKKEGIKKPVISSACPAITRLISLRFPLLCENLMPILPPIEIAAMEARRIALENHPELSSSDIGICFISRSLRIRIGIAACKRCGLADGIFHSLFALSAVQTFILLIKRVCVCIIGKIGSIEVFALCIIQ